jgi:hypothetical protein
MAARDTLREARRIAADPAGRRYLPMMSDTNVAIARRVYETYNQAFKDHEFPEEAAHELADPKLHIDVSRNVFNPAVYDGYDGLRRMFVGIWDVWDEFKMQPRQFVDANDKVAVRIEMRGRGRSGVEVSREVANVLTVRDGRVVEVIGGLEWAAALEALAREPRCEWS